MIIMEIKKKMNRLIEIYIKYSEMINYLIFGVLTTIVSLCIYYLSVNTFLNPDNPVDLQIANIFSWIVSVLFAYTTNRRYVFKSKEKNMLKESTKFIGSRISTLILDMLVMFIGVTLLKSNDKIIKVISQVLVIVGNYLVSKLFVFKQKMD